MGTLGVVKWQQVMHNAREFWNVLSVPIWCHEWQLRNYHTCLRYYKPIFVTESHQKWTPTVHDLLHSQHWHWPFKLNAYDSWSYSVSVWRPWANNIISSPSAGGAAAETRDEKHSRSSSEGSPPHPYMQSHPGQSHLRLRWKRISSSQEKRGWLPAYCNNHTNYYQEPSADGFPAK